MEEVIEGWAAMAYEYKVSRYYIRRLMAYYGFPKPVTLRRQGSITVWRRKEVDHWISTNQNLWSEYIKK